MLACDMVHFELGTKLRYKPGETDARLPLKNYPSVYSWYARLEERTGWMSPFDGIVAPDLPPVPDTK